MTLCPICGVYHDAGQPCYWTISTSGTNALPTQDSQIESLQLALSAERAAHEETKQKLADVTEFLVEERARLDWVIRNPRAFRELTWDSEDTTSTDVCYVLRAAVDAAIKEKR